MREEEGEEEREESGGRPDPPVPSQHQRTRKTPGAHNGKVEFEARYNMTFRTVARLLVKDLVESVASASRWICPR